MRILVALLAAVLIAPPGSASADTGMLARLVTEHGLTGAVLVVDDRWQAVGVADRTGDVGFVPRTHIRAASVTKPFVAATVLQLAAERRLDLDASVARYLPGRLSDVTVRQLLRHESGVAEYFDDASVPPDRPVSPDVYIDAALAKPRQFAPGSDVVYANTNYFVLGRIIESVTGAPAADEVTRRIIDPLRLVDTYFPAPGDETLRTPFAHGYAEQEGRLADVTRSEPSGEYMSGSLVSTNEDLSVFITALLDGRVLEPAQLTQMMETRYWPETGFQYGLGLVAVTLGCGVTVWGHAGGVPGYQSFVAKQIGGRSLSVTFNQSPLSSGSLADDPRAAILDAVYCTREL